MKCSLCWVDFTRNILHIHHKQKRSHGGQNTTENLIYICPNCHTIIHKVESILARGKDEQQVRDYIISLLSGLNLERDLNEASRDFYLLGLEALNKQGGEQVTKKLMLNIRICLFNRLNKFCRSRNLNRNDFLVSLIEDRVNQDGE